MSSEPDYIAAHRYSIRHRAKVEASALCGCFYCKRTFTPAEIRDWVDDSAPGLPGETALCPRCGIDSVIGSAAGYPITPALLVAMHEYWFSSADP